MNSIRMWAVSQGEAGRSLSVLEPVGSDETEHALEELLLVNSSLLESNLEIVGRQTPVGGGYLDLLGVDGDGRLVVFELKRGTLTRDAVAQVIDYVSYLDDLAEEDLVRLIESGSGQSGTEAIGDFRGWYTERHAGSSADITATPRAVLVGLGVDERAKRMVEFLSDTGMEVSLLTFHAFREGGRLLLAKQVEVEAPVKSRLAVSPQSKQDNQLRLDAFAVEHGCGDLISKVVRAVEKRMGAYVWPNATSYALSMPSRTAEGRPTQHTYLGVYVDAKARGRIELCFPPRVLDLVGVEVEK